MFCGPLYLTVTCTVFVFAFGVPDYGFSGQMTPGMGSVFNTLWFDSGYSRRQSMRLLEEFHTCWTLVFQRNAWFDCGFMLMRQTMEVVFAGDITPRAVLSSSLAGP